MFDLVHKYKKLVVVILGLIAITFATWGIESYTTMVGGREVVATVNGMEISVRLSFTRKGEVMGEPLFTFVTAGVSAEHRGIYQRAVAAALSRCAPLPLTDGLGGAIAGRPISIRFIDQRNQRGAGARP